MHRVSRLSFVAVVALLAGAAWHITLQADEDRRIGRIAARVFAPGASAKQKILAAYDAVVARVRHLPLDHPVRDRIRRDGRPFLRWSAVETWNLRLGLCGETSRLTVVLLQTGGVPSRRYALYRGTQSVHAVPAALVDGEWLWVDPDLGFLPPRDFGEWLPIGRLGEFIASPAGAVVRERLGAIDVVRAHPGPRWVQDTLAVTLPDAQLAVLERPHQMWAWTLALAAVGATIFLRAVGWARRGLRRRYGGWNPQRADIHSCRRTRP